MPHHAPRTPLARLRACGARGAPPPPLPTNPGSAPVYDIAYISLHDRRVYSLRPFRDVTVSDLGEIYPPSYTDTHPQKSTVPMVSGIK